MRKELVGLLSKAASCPKPQRKARWLPRPADPALLGGSGSQKPSLRLPFPLLPGAALWPAYGNCFYLPSTPRMRLHTVLQRTETLDSPQGRCRGCMQSSQLFCRERLGLLHQRCHLCKQVILVCRPALWMGSCSQTRRQSFCNCFVSACLSFRAGFPGPSSASDFSSPPWADCQDSGRVV